MQPRRRTRRGFSLHELCAGVSLVVRNGRQLIGTFGAEADTRRVGLGLIQARRRTISSGITHGVQFNTSGSTIVSFSVVSIVSGVATVVDGPTTFTTDLTVTSSHA